MSLINRLFGTAPQAPSPTTATAASSTARHVDLLRIVLRDAIGRHGIPAGWMAAETLQTAGPQGEPGLHLRLIVRHWDTRLAGLTVAFQNSVRQKLVLVDPMSPSWLHGVSWQFMPADESGCPPMPDPSTWVVAKSAEPAVVDVAAAAELARSRAQARAELERQFAERDGESFSPKIARKPVFTAAPPPEPKPEPKSEAKPDFEKTQPLYLPGER